MTDLIEEFMASVQLSPQRQESWPMRVPGGPLREERIIAQDLADPEQEEPDWPLS